MSKLDELREKKRLRVNSKQRHYRKWKKLKAKNRTVRMRWQLARFRADQKAIEKLNRLIEDRLEAKREAREIDWNGHPVLDYEPLLRCIRLVQHKTAVFITATLDGIHSVGSWHYKKRAFDGGSDGRQGEAPEIAAQNLLLDTFGKGYFAELFGPDDWYVKNGQIYLGVFPGHGDHLHCAVA